MAPSLSPDGRMVTFIRGGESFSSNGQIYVKLLPNGESVRLTSGATPKYAPVFTPDGSRIAYTDIAPNSSFGSWDTWTVPVLGGEPRRFLPNASGLTWLTDQQVLFAEIKGDAIHMGIVTASESRGNSREIYFPANERAMAHYAYASPDHRWVIVVEMDQSHAFHQPCRLVAFDGAFRGAVKWDLRERARRRRGRLMERGCTSARGSREARISGGSGSRTGSRNKSRSVRTRKKVWRLRRMDGRS